MYFVPFTRDARDVRVPRDARQLSRLVDATFNRSLDRFFVGDAEPAERAPALDVAESDRAYTVTLDVPGVGREDVHVSVEGRRVTVRTQKQATAETEMPASVPVAADQVADAAKPTAPATPATATARVVYRERAAVSYARSFTLPVEVEQAEAGAKLENGVLTLTLPKRNARLAAQITVN